MAQPTIKAGGDGGMLEGDTLRQIQTSESVLLPMPRDVFEKLYLEPKQPKAGNLYRQFGNPTPVALLGFLIAGASSSCIGMGWRGAGGGGGAILSAYIFFGGMLQVLGAIGEFIIGNTFSSVLFSTYGCFWLYNGTSLMPYVGIGANYTSETSPEFYATVGFFYVFITVLTFFYMICAIRTNCCLLTCLFCLVLSFACSTASNFHAALGHTELAHRYQTAGGAFTLCVCITIAPVFVAELFEAIDFPISIPVGDLSTVIQGRNQRNRRERNHGEHQQATV